MPLTITIVSDRRSWMNGYIPALIESLAPLGHETEWLHDVSAIRPGDMVFFLSCEQIVSRDILNRNRHNLVVHASHLPQGKGWSPLTWKIVNGENSIPVVLFEAEDKVDSGDIYITDVLHFNGLELVDELRTQLALKTNEMCLRFVTEYPGIAGKSVRQNGESSYYPRRTPEDSRLDPDKSLGEQFNLLRVADNEKYPCYFDLGGQRYIIKIEKKQSAV